MSDKKIGLALGGGGAKGLAHIGVIKVLQENNVPVDMIAGSSMGAVIGGLYAAKQDPTEIEKIANKTDWRLLLSLLDPSWGQGLIEGEKITDFIKEHLGDVGFEDLKIPLSVVATDIKSGEPVVLNEGNVVSAIRASISLPLIFKPVEYKNKLLTDGDLSRPVPVEIVKNMGADIVIAVNLHTNNFEENAKLSSYRVVNRSLDLLRYHLAQYNVKGADYVINPEVGDIQWNEFLSSEEAIEAGKKATQNNVAKIRELI